VNGQVFQTQRNYGEDTIPAFFEVYAAMRGQQLARAADSLPIMRDDQYLTPIEYEIPVEVGASILHVSVSNYDAAKDNFLDNIERIALVSPSGTIYQRHPANPYDHDYISPLSTSFHIPLPESGTWVLQDNSWVGTAKEQRHARLYVAAFSENPVPGCDVGTSVRVSDGNLPVQIRALARNDRPVATGDSYSVLLQRPDMTVAKFGLTKSDQGQPATGEVGPSLFTGDGVYVATVTCTVTEGAPLVNGERTLPLNGAPLEPDTVSSSHAFTRQVHVYFQVKGTGIVPLPGVHGDNQDPTVLGTYGLPPGYSPVVPFVIDSDGDGIKTPQ